MLIDRSPIQSINCFRTPWGRFSSAQSWASDAQNHSAHLITQPFDFFGIRGVPEALGEVEKLWPSPLSAAIVFSTNSTSIRLALGRRVFAMVRAWPATFAGRLTLCRTA